MFTLRFQQTNGEMFNIESHWYKTKLDKETGGRILTAIDIEDIPVQYYIGGDDNYVACYVMNSAGKTIEVVQ